MKIVSTNPSDNYSVLGEIEPSSEKDIKAAVANARKAQILWAEIGIDGRKEKLMSFMEICKARRESIAKSIATETGRTIRDSRADVDEGINYFEQFIILGEKYLADEMVYENETETHVLIHEPHGVIACISPWNFPFLSIPWQAGRALIAGNAVVYKVSEEDILFGKLIEQLVKESDIPEGVFSCVHGDGTVGELLVRQQVDAIMFTGSTATGQRIARTAAETMTPFYAEMGGSAPGIIFKDADTRDVIETIYNLRFSLSGQDCVGLKRLLVHESIFNDVVEKLSAISMTRKLGTALDETTDIGPLVAERQVTRLEEQVKDAIDKGARVILGAKRPDGLLGAYYEPTILTNVTTDMKVWREEVFGPVLPIVSFSTDTEAISLANDTIYGLGAYIFTTDKKRYNTVARRIHAGEVSINNTSFYSPNTPFGGFRSSGNSYAGGRIGFDEVTRIKVISEER